MDSDGDTKPREQAQPLDPGAPPGPGVDRPAEAAAAAGTTPRPRRRFPVGLALFALFVLALLLHTAMDRFVPYTSEASLQAPVVGVAPNVSGTIIAVAVRDNQPVQTGDLLFQIDPQRFQTAVAQAEANLSAAVISFGAGTVALQAAAAKLSDAQASLVNERAQFERTQTLAARDYSSKASLDTSRAKLAGAEAAVQAAQSSLDEARRRLGPSGEENPQVRAALAHYERARIDLADVDVRAPIDGMVTNTVLAPGQFASSGRRVATIIDTASAWVIANLPENTLGHVRVGDSVLITFNVAPGHLVNGRVASMASGIAQTLSAAAGIEGPLPFVVQRRQWLREVQRVPVRIELDRQQDIPVVRVGSRANVVIVTDRAGAGEIVGRAWLSLVSIADYVF